MTKHELFREIEHHAPGIPDLLAWKLVEWFWTLLCPKMREE
jgi:hypothetical protein